MRGLKDIRLKNYDYTTNGYYFITVVSRFRQNIFAEKKSLVQLELYDLISQIDGLSLDYFGVMNNHVHAILILDNCKLNVGEIVRRFKAKVSHAFGKPVWQPNYYEHVIRNEKALYRIREYIVNNPQAEILKFAQFYN